MVQLKKGESPISGGGGGGGVLRGPNKTGKGEENAPLERKGGGVLKGPGSTGKRLPPSSNPWMYYR